MLVCDKCTQQYIHGTASVKCVCGGGLVCEDCAKLRAKVERLDALVAAKNERLAEADAEVERLRGALERIARGAEAGCSNQFHIYESRTALRGEEG